MGLINILIIYTRKRIYLKMSSHLQWMCVRNNSAFLIKGAGQTFSTEKNNLKGKNSFRYNGLVHSKSVGVNVAPSSEGSKVLFTTTRVAGSYKPNKRVNTVEFKTSAGPRRVLSKIRKTSSNRYRKDLKTIALRRASALMQGQKKATKPAAK